MDWNATYINVLTASSTLGGRLPIHFPSDRECLERMAPTVGKFDASDVTIGWIRNTLELRTLGISENLQSEICGNPMLEVLGPARPLEYDDQGNLVHPEEW